MAKVVGMEKEVDYKAEYLKRVAREKKAYMRRAIRIDLYVKKAIANGIVVTEAEVDEEYKKKLNKK